MIERKKVVLSYEQTLNAKDYIEKKALLGWKVEKTETAKGILGDSLVLHLTRDNSFFSYQTVCQIENEINGLETQITNLKQQRINSAGNFFTREDLSNVLGYFLLFLTVCAFVCGIALGVGYLCNVERISKATFFVGIGLFILGSVMAVLFRFKVLCFNIKRKTPIDKRIDNLQKQIEACYQKAEGLIE